MGTALGAAVLALVGICWSRRRNRRKQRDNALRGGAGGGPPGAAVADSSPGGLKPGTNGGGSWCDKFTSAFAKPTPRPYGETNRDQTLFRSDTTHLESPPFDAVAAQQGALSAGVALGGPSHGSAGSAEAAPSDRAPPLPPRREPSMDNAGGVSGSGGAFSSGRSTGSNTHASTFESGSGVMNNSTGGGEVEFTPLAEPAAGSDYEVQLGSPLTGRRDDPDDNGDDDGSDRLDELGAHQPEAAGVARLPVAVAFNGAASSLFRSPSTDGGTRPKLAASRADTGSRSK